MPETPGDANDLKKHIGVVVGHGAGVNSEVKDEFICVYVVRISDQWVLCQRKGKGLYDWGRARKGLGAMIAGASFAKHAYKSIPLTLPFWRLKKFLEDSLGEHNITFEWIDEDATPWEGIVPDVQEEKALAQEARWAKEEALVPGAKIRTLRGWADRSPVPVKGTLGRVVKGPRRMPPNTACVEFTPPLVVHSTQEELPEECEAYRLYYKFDDLEIVEGP